MASHRNEKGAVPPDGTTVALPLEAEKQMVSATAGKFSDRTAGSTTAVVRTFSTPFLVCDGSAIIARDQIDDAGGVGKSSLPVNGIERRAAIGVYMQFSVVSTKAADGFRRCKGQKISGLCDGLLVCGDICWRRTR